jgi:hypothetical protein
LNWWYIDGSFRRISSAGRREAMSRNTPPRGDPRPALTSALIDRATSSREATERDLKAKLRKKAKVRMGRVSLSKTPEEVRREWDEADDDLVRRAILSRYLKAVIIRKTGRRGPGDLDYSAIEPVWREDGEYAPLDHVIY